MLREWVGGFIKDIVEDVNGEQKRKQEEDKEYRLQQAHK